MRPKDKRSLVHGTLDGYKAYGCRCPACREIWDMYTQEYRETIFDETTAKRRPVKIKPWEEVHFYSEREKDA